jgi:hypothetical protein
MSIIDQQAEEFEAAELMTNRQKYLAALRQANAADAAGKKLPAADLTRLLELAKSLGRNQSVDRKTLSEMDALAGAEGKLVALDAAHVKAMKTERDYDDETKRLQTEHETAMKARIEARPQVEYVARTALEEAKKAAEAHRVLRWKHSRLLCIPTTAPTAPKVEGGKLVEVPIPSTYEGHQHRIGGVPIDEVEPRDTRSIVDALGK